MLSLITTSLWIFVIFSHFYLHISKKKCNFAAGNVKNELQIRARNVRIFENLSLGIVFLDYET